MARWAPDAAGRLQTAALELYAERGFEQTTVADIAARAGVTARTYFRHFIDKREVLFSGQSELQAFLAEWIETQAGPDDPMTRVIAGLEAAAAHFPDKTELSVKRSAIIASNAELRERELQKLASLAAVIAEALGRSGIDPAAARIVGEVGMMVFKLGYERWIGGDHTSFAATIRSTFDDLRTAMRGEGQAAARQSAGFA